MWRKRAAKGHVWFVDGVAHVPSAGRPAGRAAVIRIQARQPGYPVFPVLAALVVLGGAAIALLRLDRLPVPFCFFKTVTGIPCMTCGSTRALGRLAALDFAGALRVNPLATVALTGVFAVGLLQLALSVQGRTLRVSMPPGSARVLWILAGALVLLNWIYLIWAGV